MLRRDPAGEAEFDDEEDGSMSGFAEIRVPLRRVGPGATLRVDFGYTVCDAKSCKPARMVQLVR